MRTMNGRYTNRLPAETTPRIAEVGRSVATGAAQAVLVVTAIRLIDAAFQFALDKMKSRRTAD